MPRIPYRFQKLIHNSKPSPVNGLFICHFHNSICHSHTSPRRVSKLRIRSHPKTNPPQAHRPPWSPQNHSTQTSNLWPSFLLLLLDWTVGCWRQSSPNLWTPRVVLLIMKNISHLNQYDQWPQPQPPTRTRYRENLSDSTPTTVRWLTDRLLDDPRAKT